MLYIRIEIKKNELFRTYEKGECAHKFRKLRYANDFKFKSPHNKNASIIRTGTNEFWLDVYIAHIAVVHKKKTHASKLIQAYRLAGW